MTQQLTFIHAADLHLGAPFRGLRALSEKWAARLLRAIPEAYERVVEAALARNVDFVVIAGDVFDTARASYADYRLFFEGLERLSRAGIPVYLCTGNHDPYTSWQHDFFALPDGCVMLSAEHPDFALYERDGEPLCVLGGRSYYNQTWPADRRIAEGVTRAAAERVLGERAKAAPFGVGVLHTGLNLDPVKAPADPAELLAAGFDYWALGHIHSRQVIPQENPRMSFSGCIQGRDIKETGPRGVNLVTLTEGAPNEISFVPTASVVWQRLEVDVSAAENLSEVCDIVVRALFRENGRAQCEEMCVRITLSGATELHSALSSPRTLEDLRSQLNGSYAEFFCDALIDGTRRPIDEGALRREGLFPAAFLAAADGAVERRDETLAYLQDEFLSRGLVFPAAIASELAEVASEAKLHALDMLLGGDAR